MASYLLIGTMLLNLYMVIIAIIDFERKKKKRKGELLTPVGLTLTPLTIGILITKKHTMPTITIDANAIKMLLGFERTDTHEPITPDSFGPITFASFDDTILGVALDSAPNTIDLQEVKPGTTQLKISTTVVYTDPALNISITRDKSLLCDVQLLTPTSLTLTPVV